MVSVSSVDSDVSRDERSSAKRDISASALLPPQKKVAVHAKPIPIGSGIRRTPHVRTVAVEDQPARQYRPAHAPLRILPHFSRVNAQPTPEDQALVTSLLQRIQAIPHVLNTEQYQIKLDDILQNPFFEAFLQRIRQAPRVVYRDERLCDLDRNIEQADPSNPTNPPRIWPAFLGYYRCLYVPGDGHCQFYAMSYCLLGSPHFHLHLRLLCIWMFRKHWNYFYHLFVDGQVRPTMQRAIYDTAYSSGRIPDGRPNESAWGDQPHLVAIATAAQRPVHNYTAFTGPVLPNYFVNADEAQASYTFSLINKNGKLKCICVNLNNIIAL